MHAFLQADSKNGSGDWEIGISIDDEMPADRETFASWQVPVAKHFQKASDSMVYLYDFGDDWSHDVILEEIIACDSEILVACTGGERACPPEDCGCPWAYKTMLERLADPGHYQHEDMKRWICGSFSPENFDPATVTFDDPRERWNRAFDETRFRQISDTSCAL